MIELNNLETTYEIVMEDLVEWIDQGGLEKYIKEKYNKYAIYYGGGLTEVFIDDKELHDDGIEDVGYLDLFNTVNHFMKEKYNIDIEGEQLSWIVDEACGEIVDVMKLSNFEFEDSGIKISENKEILYCAFDEATEKELRELKK